MAQSVDGSGSAFVVAGTPQTLFRMTGVAWNFLFDTYDGKPFVMIVEGERDPSPLTVVVNWTPPRRWAIAAGGETPTRVGPTTTTGSTARPGRNEGSQD